MIKSIRKSLRLYFYDKDPFENPFESKFTLWTSLLYILKNDRYISYYTLYLTHCILILHLTFCILHFASYTLNLTHCLIHIASYTLHDKHLVLHIAFYILYFTYCILQIASYILYFTHYKINI